METQTPDFKDLLDFFLCSYRSPMCNTQVHWRPSYSWDGA